MIGGLACFASSSAWACEKSGSAVPYARPTAVNFARPTPVNYARPFYPPPPMYYANMYNGYNPAAAYLNSLNNPTPPYANGLINYSTPPYDNCNPSRQQLFVRSPASAPPAAPAAPAVSQNKPAPPAEPAVKMQQIQLAVNGVRNASDAEYLEHHLGKVAGVKMVSVKRNKTDGTTTMKVWYAEKDPIGPETLISATAKLGFSAESDVVAAGGG